LLAADRVAATVAQGVHGRRRVGQGESFWQFRAYEPGDPVQRIDWRQTAKRDRPFLREQEWAAAQTAYLWRAGDAGMNWASDPARLPTKRARADLLLIALASLLDRAGERIVLLGRDQAPRQGRAGLARLAARLEAEAEDDTGAELPPDTPLPRHASAVLFGDFLAPLESIEARVTGLAERSQSGALVQILDPAEETLPFAGRVLFDSPREEERVLVPRAEALRQAYAERLGAQRDGLAAIARAAGWQLITHRTDQSPETALLALYTLLAAE
jgi:uncharacterized protein (DUF58 family)